MRSKVLKNDLFVRTANGENTERSPVWMMRQAGRILPQYNEVRKSLSGFKELVKSPTFASEVTIQPVDELNVDAAIIFSDILVIPEALGLNYEMIEAKGPYFEKTIKTKSDIDSLNSAENAANELQYVYEAIQLTTQKLDARVPLIGFCGAPWTIFAYMIEGGGSKTFSKAKRFLYQNPTLAHQLLDKITETSILYLKNQIKSGADVIQIFDSWAGILSPEQYAEFSAKYIKKIVDAIDEVPKIVFAKGAWFAWNDFVSWNKCIVGLDWNISPKQARSQFGDKAILQGNLDPCLLYAEPELIRDKTNEMLKGFGQHHIANLGHGVYPDTPLANAKVFIDTVKNFTYK
ncbi:MAG: uroporphyrinogen decarboxylase [Saprospiraceae bacterium]|nr:uroporphyrinogen decarboxylase [Saprospiraceae bacterium]